MHAVFNRRTAQCGVQPGERRRVAPLLVVEYETDAAAFGSRRSHELSDGLEHDFELGVVLGFERG